jgi:tetratricopeptide (TPR) repeat protein
LYIALFHADLAPHHTFAAAAGMALQASVPQARTDDPDALYANRTDLASAKKAAEIWEARLRDNPKDFDTAAKLTRTYYWLGRHAADDERRAFLERGIAAGRAAVALQPNRPEGHFWIAANMGGLAESYGLRQGIKYRGEIRDELMTTLRLDAAFQQGSADRALGRWYYKVPGLFGGSNAKAEEHLRRSLTYSPGNTASLYFLAEVLIATKRNPEAQAVLQKLIASPGEPGWGPEDHEYKVKGQRLLDKLKSGE